jgi:hypothetical protein
MAYRNGTYVAFHAKGTSDPAASDMKYYTIMQAWDAHKKIDFQFVNSHDKTAAVRDSSLHSTLERRLKERLNDSKNMVLIITASTKLDTDWVPFELEYAIDDCGLPLIAAYPDYRAILTPRDLSYLWPSALRSRISDRVAKVIHIPFAQDPLMNAIEQFTVHTNELSSGFSFYSEKAHRKWGLIGPVEIAEGNLLKN